MRTAGGTAIYEALAPSTATSVVPPAPKPKKIARKRTTAPPPDDTGQTQQSGGSFPAPVPSGTFTR